MEDKCNQVFEINECPLSDYLNYVLTTITIIFRRAIEHTTKWRVTCRRASLQKSKYSDGGTWRFNIKFIMICGMYE